MYGRIYYYGEHKWADYLIDNRERLESIREAQDQANELTQRSLDQMKAANEDQLDQLRQIDRSIGELQSTLVDGVMLLSERIDSGFEKLGAEFEWGFTLVIDQMESQRRQFTSIIDTLDRIHETLESPLLTQARELFRLGQEYLGKGLLD